MEHIMPKIRFTAASPKAGKTEHVNTATASTLIAAGFAELVRYENFVEFMNSNHREGSDPSNSNPPQVSSGGVEWSCARITDRAVIFRKKGGECARMETIEQAVAYGCPESVLSQFRAFENVLTGIAASAETVAQEQYRASARETADSAGVWKQLFSRA
jgi:hypothetical protein